MEHGRRRRQRGLKEIGFEGRSTRTSCVVGREGLAAKVEKY